MSNDAIQQHRQYMFSNTEAVHYLPACKVSHTLQQPSAATPNAPQPALPRSEGGSTNVNCHAINKPEVGDAVERPDPLKVQQRLSTADVAAAANGVAGADSQLLEVQQSMAHVPAAAAPNPARSFADAMSVKESCQQVSQGLHTAAVSLTG